MLVLMVIAMVTAPIRNCCCVFSKVFVLLFDRHCGISDPSWCELKHFIDFLNSQLQDCEESYYTNAANVDDQWMQGTMRGFKSFVVRFMVTMSRVRPLFCHILCLFFPSF